MPIKPWKYWIRKLHDSSELSCELYVYKEGDRMGWDDHYVNTYWNETEAKHYAEKLLSSPRNVHCDIGHGYEMILPD